MNIDPLDAVLGIGAAAVAVAFCLVAVPLGLLVGAVLTSLIAAGHARPRR